MCSSGDGDEGTNLSEHAYHYGLCKQATSKFSGLKQFIFISHGFVGQQGSTGQFSAGGGMVASLCAASLRQQLGLWSSEGPTQQQVPVAVGRTLAGAGGGGEALSPAVGLLASQVAFVIPRVGSNPSAIKGSASLLPFSAGQSGCKAAQIRVGGGLVRGGSEWTLPLDGLVRPRRAETVGCGLWEPQEQGTVPILLSWAAQLRLAVAVTARRAQLWLECRDRQSPSTEKPLGSPSPLSWSPRCCWFALGNRNVGQALGTKVKAVIRRPIRGQHSTWPPSHILTPL